VKKATEDGSTGRKGSVIELARDLLAARGAARPLRIFACGPEQMFFRLRAAIDEFCPEPERVRCQVSFEQFMGCGVGVCCACAIPTRQGYKKVCKDGPVFSLHELKERGTE
jgi:dihydroorotate dehydrogenase electron transfer subunit